MSFSPDTLADVPLLLDSVGATVTSAATAAPGTEVANLASRCQLDWSVTDERDTSCRVYAVAKGSSAVVGFTINVRDITSGVTVATVTVAAGTSAVEAVGSWAALARPTAAKTYGVFAQSITTVSSPVLYVVRLQMR